MIKWLIDHDIKYGDSNATKPIFSDTNTNNNNNNNSRSKNNTMTIQPLYHRSQKHMENIKQRRMNQMNNFPVLNDKKFREKAITFQINKISNTTIVFALFNVS